MKKPFLLVEVLIAFTLVTLCVVPLIHFPLKMLKKENEQLELMEEERLADLVFSEIKELFLKGDIPDGKLPLLNQTTGPFSLQDLSYELPGCKEKKIPCHYTLYGKGKKEGPGGEDFRMIYVKIFLNNHEYAYRLPVQKL